MSHTKTLRGGGLANTVSRAARNTISRLAAITLALGLATVGTLITPTTGMAADSLTAPECTGSWTASDRDSNNPADWLLPDGNTSQRPSYQRCGEITKVTGNSVYYGPYTMIIKAMDDGYRVWFSDLTAGRIYGGERESLNANNYGDGIFQDRDGTFYAVAILDGASSLTTMPAAGIQFKATSTNAVMQILHLNTDVPTHVLAVIDANGGQFPDGETMHTPWIIPTGLQAWTASNTPIRTGYVFKQWSTDQAGQHPLDSGTKLTRGQHVYAQWEKAAGKPQKADLDCSTGGRCELTVNYTDSPAKTREFQPGNNELTWTGSPIDGVLLDASGYAADGACSDTRCWYVSLKDAPQTPASYQAQMPTTGAPEGLSAAGVIAACVGVFGLLLTVKRRRD